MNDNQAAWERLLAEAKGTAFMSGVFATLSAAGAIYLIVLTSKAPLPEGLIYATLAALLAALAIQMFRRSFSKNRKP